MLAYFSYAIFSVMGSEVSAQWCEMVRSYTDYFVSRTAVLRDAMSIIEFSLGDSRKRKFRIVTPCMLSGVVHSIEVY